MLIYIITFILCLVIDKLNNKSSYVIKSFLIAWVYVFLCFGYMTGSDWRHYEILYSTATDRTLLSTEYESGFYVFIYFVRGLISDFWIFLAIVKILYLSSVISLIKQLTVKVFTSLAILLPFNVLFMLIDNPLRFMIGSIFFLQGIKFLLNKQYYKYILISILSIFFHISLIIPILVSLTLFFKNKLIKKNNTALFLIYIACFIISLFPILINSIFELLAERYSSIALKLLYAYNVESIDVVFTLGSFLSFILFLIILKFRKYIVESHFGPDIFYFTLLYFYMFRILIIVPTGFRLFLHFALFLSIALVIIIHKTNILFKFGIISFSGMLMLKLIFSTYQYLPYTNSITFILTDHLNYGYRYEYNKIYYRNRTGKEIEEYKFEAE